MASRSARANRRRDRLRGLREGNLLPGDGGTSGGRRAGGTPPAVAARGGGAGAGRGSVGRVHGLPAVHLCAHFPAIWAINAHSFFRYMSQLSLAVMLGLLTWLRPLAAGWVARRDAAARRRMAAGAIAVAVVLPVLAAPLLRFDLDAPQPFLWEIGHRAAALLGGSARVAIVAPGDGDDAVGSMLRGVLLFTARGVRCWISARNGRPRRRPWRRRGRRVLPTRWCPARRPGWPGCRPGQPDCWRGHRTAGIRWRFGRFQPGCCGSGSRPCCRKWRFAGEAETKPRPFGPLRRSDTVRAFFPPTGRPS